MSLHLQHRRLDQVEGEQLTSRVFGPRVRELWRHNWQVRVWQYPNGTYEFQWEVWDRMFMLRTDDLVLAGDNFNHMYWEIMLLVPQVQIPCC